MMKYISLCLILSLKFSFFSQIVPQAGMKRCDSAKIARKGQRFTDWECGKLAGVINCNEGLELDQGSNMVYRKADNTQFLEDANKPFSGTCETCHSNGILERRVTFVNGKQNGTDTTFYETGCPMVIRTHIEGEENGRWIFYHDTTVSIIAWEMNFFAGEKHGRQIYFTKKGDTTLLEHYQYGLLDGKKVKYYPHSKPERIINYKAGLFDGEFIIFNEEGKILEKLNYKEGKKNGECAYFYSDGKPLKTEFWLMGVKSGEFKTFFYQGALQTLETWTKGSGKEKEYFSFDTYECPTMGAAKEVSEKLNQKMKAEQIIQEMNSTAVITLYEDRMIEQDERPFLKGKKLGRGINEVYKYKDKFYVVVGIDRQVIAKKEVKDGRFEEYFPNTKPKRIAIYKKDVLIEEHIYDQFGNELSSFGGKTTNKSEDDALPEKGKKKKKIKK